MDNTIDMFSGLGLDVLGIRHNHIFHNRDLEPLTLFMVDHLPVHNRESTTSISPLGTYYFVLQTGKSQGIDNERVSEDKPLHIFIARGFSVTTHVHEPTVTHTVVFQNGGDVDGCVNTHLSVEVLLHSLSPLQHWELFQPHVISLYYFLVFGVFGSTFEEAGS